MAASCNCLKIPHSKDTCIMLKAQFILLVIIWNFHSAWSAHCDISQCSHSSTKTLWSIYMLTAVHTKDDYNDSRPADNVIHFLHETKKCQPYLKGRKKSLNMSHDLLLITEAFCKTATDMWKFICLANFKIYRLSIKLINWLRNETSAGLLTW